MKSKFKVGDKVIVDVYTGRVYEGEANIPAVVTEVSKNVDEDDDGNEIITFDYAVYTPHDDNHSAWYWEYQFIRDETQ